MKILCVGQLVTDIIAAPVDYFNLGTDTLPVEQIVMGNGGDCMNVSVNLSKLGCPVCFCGMVGKDPFGEYLSNVLVGQGIDIRGLAICDGVSTSTAIGLVNQEGQRIFLYSGGANEYLTAESVPEALFQECGHLHIGGTYLLPRLDGAGSTALLKKAKDYGMTTSMDVTWDAQNRWLSVVEPYLPYLDLFMPSEEEAKRITGLSDPEQMADFFIKRGVKISVIKLGEKGGYLKGEKEGFYFAPFQVPVVDTTGAGDAFVGGFLSQYTKGESLKNCARFASAVSANCIQAVGATAAAPNEETINRFLKENELNGRISL